MRQARAAGFTLVELLIVMVIIGVLAAVAVPVLMAQRTAAFETTMKADAREVGRVMESYYGEQGRYAASMADLEAAIPPPTQLSGENQVQLVAAYTSADAFCLQVTNPRADDIYVDSDGGGLLEPGIPCT